MSLLVPWIVFPLVLGGLSLGAGLALDRLTGERLPTALLLPTGAAAITVAAGFTTAWSRTATVTVPVAVALAVLGFAATRRSPRRAWLEPHATAAGAAAFLAVGAPVLVSGEATFTGYVTLDDTATFLALADHMLEHGRDVSGLAPSSHEATLWVNLAHGYPTGSLLPFGTASRLVGSDGAWLFQPYLAFLAALVAVGLYALAEEVIPGRRRRALAAAAASQAALLYGFALWGGVKELYVAALLPLVAATLTRPQTAASAAVPAVGVAALLLAASLGSIVWLAPAAAAVLAARRLRRKALSTLALASLLGVPALLQASDFLRAGNRAAFRDASELGNLFAPLSPLQTLGIWLTDDFRSTPDTLLPTAIFLGLAGALAALGLATAACRRATPLLLCAACALTGAVVVSATASPWLAGKTLAVAAPVTLLLAFVGAARAVALRPATPVLFAALAAGVLASNALAARAASLAPHDQLRELEEIGERFAGRGPALMTEYQPYGVRHFLRRLDAEGAGELRRRPVPRRDGRVPGKGESPDLDSLQAEAVALYRTIVLRRKPEHSTPSAAYSLAWRGRFYEVWQRDPHAPVVLEHVALGADVDPAAPAPCGEVLRLAERARAANGLVAARRAGGAAMEAPVYVAPSRAEALCGRTLDWIEAVRPASG